MIISYRKLLNKSQMIFSDFFTTEFEENYIIKMFTKNSLNGFLPAELQLINSTPTICYDITSKHSLLSYLETRKIDFKLFSSIMNGLFSACNTLNSYMLDNCFLILAPDYIFLESDLTTPSFCYCPIKENNKNYSLMEQLRILMDFIITRIDYSDKELIAAAYTLHQNIINETFTLNDFILSHDNISPEVFIQDKNDVTSEISDINYDFFTESKTTEDSICDNKPYIKKSTFFNNNCLSSSDFNQLFYKYKLTYIIAAIVFIISTYLRFVEKTISETIFFVMLFFAASIIFIFQPGIKKFKNSETIKQNNLTPENDISKELNETDLYEIPINNTLDDTSIEEIGETVLINTSALYSHPHLIYNGNDFSDDFELTTFPFIIGKLPETSNHIIHNSMISRIHAKIHFREDGYYIEDMNSSNGTFLNGSALPPHTLTLIADNDIISFATLSYTFKS